MLGQMSIKVEMGQLAETITQHDYAYLLSPGGARPHVVQVSPVVEPTGLHLPTPGRSALRLASEHPAVTVLFPPRSPGGYSLIVDGVAEREGDNLRVAVDHAVLHRPAAPDSPASTTGCESDCCSVEA